MNNFLPKFGLSRSTVDKSAFSKARKKLKHTAFIALNQEAVIKTIYREDSDYSTYKGLRILGVDGSKIQLPTNDETIETFGSFDYHSNQPDGQGSIVSGTHSYALASTLYDVLNHVALDALLEPSHSYEVDLAVKHLTHTLATDLVIYDRGYCSFRMLAAADQAVSHFLIRCHGNSFTIVNEMLKGSGSDDVIITLTANRKFLTNSKNKNLPTKIRVRLVRVKLDNGEHEVLATSLLDQDLYPTSCFKELYYFRWGIETFYGILKTRLQLENFSGYSVEAIRQDFFATILLTGVETILTEDAEEQLGKQKSGHPKKVNKAVSFNIIKDRAFEIFCSKAPDEKRLNELTQIFLTSPTIVRKDRKPPRKNPSSHRILGYWKRLRKAVF